MKVPISIPACASQSRQYRWILSLLLVASAGIAYRSAVAAEVESGRGAAADGGSAAGRESFKSDLFAGAMAMSVPIELPPGTNGMQPTLAFAYNSSTGFTWLGRGWDLAFPQIQRMTRFGVPRYDDDPATGDLFSIDDDRLVRDASGNYHKMREDFSVITRVPAAGVVDYWKVETKDGHTEWYGSTPDSRIVNTSNQRTARWLLARAEDANGNFINYEYFTVAETGDDGNAYPKRISYSFRGDESPASSTIRTIDFTLNAGVRDDETVIYSAGLRTRKSKRLESVAVRSGGTLVTRYDVVYQDETGLSPENGRSLIARIERSGSTAGAPLPSDSFSYSTGTSGATTWLNDPDVATRLSELHVGTATGVDLTNGQWKIIDVNGDAAPDVIATIPVGSGGEIFYRSAFINTKRGTHGVPLFLAAGTSTYTPAFLPPVMLGSAEWTDYTGDGRPEVFSSGRDVDNQYPSYHANHRNTGTNWIPELSSSGYANPPARRVFSRTSCFWYIGSRATMIATRLLDVNGDGLADLVEHRPPDEVTCSQILDRSKWTVWNVYLNTGAGWSPERDPTWSASLQVALTQLNARLFETLPIDVNGDGLVDLLRDTNGNGVSDGPTALVNDGVGWGIDELLSSIPNDFYPADLNGDGLADSVGSNPRLGQGTWFRTASFTVPSPFATPGAGKIFVDLDADGLLDLVRADGTNYDVRFASHEAPADLLIAIDTSEGARVDISYASTGDGSCWDATPGGCNADLAAVSWPIEAIPQCSYPLSPSADGTKCLAALETLPTVVQTVGSMTIDDRNGNAATESSRRDFGRYDADEREFRGFGQVLERPQTMSYVNPADPNGSAVDLGVLKLHSFYQLAFLRGRLASSALYASADEQLDATDTLLHKEIRQYAITRGDTSITLLLQSNLSTLQCDPTLENILDPSGAPSECAFIDLEQSPYLSAVSLLAPFPYSPFRDRFTGATDRDRQSAYLVLEVGSMSRDIDGGVSTDGQIWRWHDPFGNVQGEWSWGDVADVGDDRFVLTAYAEPDPNGGGPSNLRSHTSEVHRMAVTPDPGTASAQVVTVSRLRIDYDGLSNGLVGRGNITAGYADLDDPVNNLSTLVAMIYSYPAPESNYGLPDAVSDPTEASHPIRFTTISYDASKTFPAQRVRGSFSEIVSYDPPNAPPGMGIVHTHTDANGNTQTFSADRFGRPLTRSGPAPLMVTESIAYDDFTGFDPSRSRSTELKYDGTGASVSIQTFTDGLGRPIRRERTGLRAGDVSDVIIHATRYDLQGRVSFSGRPYFQSDPPATGTTRYYDTRGRDTFIIQPDGGVSETQHVGLTTISVDADGRRREYRRDGAGSVLEVREFSGTQMFTTRYAYDGVGRNVAVCDAVSGANPCTTGSNPRHTRATTYDSLGRPVRESDPDRGISERSFDGRGKFLRDTDARGVSTRYVYDGVFGRLEEVDYDFDGSADVLYTYGDEAEVPPQNALLRPYVITEPGGVTLVSYDSRGRAIERATQFAGNPTPYSVAVTYDWMNRETSIAYPDGEVVTTTYDAMGPDRVASPQRTYVADVESSAEGEPMKITYGNGDLREIHYSSASGHLSSIRGKHGNSPSFLDRTYQWDYSRNVVSVADSVTPADSLVAIQYDGMGRLVSATRQSPVPETLSYSYDAIGNLTSKEGITQPFGHPSKPHVIFDPADPSRFVYDSSGNPVAQDGKALTYDARGRLSAVSGSIPTMFEYSAAGQRLLKVRGADTSAFLGPGIEIKNADRYVKTIRVGGMIVAQVSTQPSAGAASTPSSTWISPLSGSAFLLLAGLAALLACAVAAELAAPVPISVWRQLLASALVAAVGVGPVLPLLALGALKGDANLDGRFDGADALVVLRSLDGGLALVPEARDAGDVAPFSTGPVIGDGAASIGDVLVLLRGMSDADLDGDGLSRDTETALGLSPFSRDTDGDGILDGDEDADQDGLSDGAELSAGTNPLIADTDGDGYVDSDDSAPMAPAGTLVHWIHTDHLGGPVVMTDSDGTVVRKLAYGVFGEIRTNSNVGPASTPDIDEKFTGQRFDEETGLSYYKARYYDAGAGRFLTADSVIADSHRPQHLNRYAYVLNNPVSRIDPTGHLLVEPPFNSGSGTQYPSAWNSYEAERRAQDQHWESIRESSRYRLQVMLCCSPTEERSSFALGATRMTRRMGNAIAFGVKVQAVDTWAFIVGAAVGKPTTLLWDIGDIVQSAVDGDARGFAKAIALTIYDAAFPTYGYYTGSGWGVRQFGGDGSPMPFNRFDAAGFNHDIQPISLQWIQDAWSSETPGLPPGLIGGVYLAVGTPVFYLASFFE